MTGALPTEGLSYLVVTVLSVEENVALVRDQVGRQLKIRRDFQRAKGPWPEPDEQWIIDKTYGNEWTFALLITPSQTPLARPLIMPVATLTERNALTSLDAGQMVLRADTHAMDYYDGTTWRGTKPIVAQTGAINTAGTDVFASTVKIATIPCPDPGWPYYLKFYGHLSLRMGTNTGVDVQFRDGDGITGTIFNGMIYSIDGRAPGNQSAASDANGAKNFPIALPSSGTALTGARTVSVVLSKWQGTAGDGWKINDAGLTKIYAEMMPY